MVSIIIPNYNKATCVEATLQSIANQSYNDWECVVVDDQSTDNSSEIIRNFIKKDSRFSFFIRTNDKPKGPSSCRNIGIEKAVGNYLMFLDSDDLLARFCLEQRTNAFYENLDCDFLVFQMERFQTVPNEHSVNPLKTISTKHNAINFLQLHGDWQVTSPIYKSDFFKKNIKFNEELRSFEDLEVAVKAITFSNKYFVFDAIDSFYRNDENYKKKYTNKSQYDLTLLSFDVFLHSVHQSVIEKISDVNKKKSYKNALVQGYKKLFLSIVIEFVSDYKKRNKSLLFFFNKNGYLSLNQKIKFYFVHHVLFMFYRIKGLGLYRFINYLYK